MTAILQHFQTFCFHSVYGYISMIDLLMKYDVLCIIKADQITDKHFEDEVDTNKDSILADFQHKTGMS